jgi:hypothetical protein
MKNIPLFLATLAIVWMSLTGTERIFITFFGGLLLGMMMLVTYILTLISKQASRSKYLPRDGFIASVHVLLCLSIMLTSWPLCLAFACVRPTMEQIAQQVLLDKSVPMPRRVGLFTIKAVHYEDEQLCLWTDDSSNAPAGFVLPFDGVARGNINDKIALGGRWHFLVTD